MCRVGVDAPPPLGSSHGSAATTTCGCCYLHHLFQTSLENYPHFLPPPRCQNFETKSLLLDIWGCQPLPHRLGLQVSDVKHPDKHWFSSRFKGAKLSGCQTCPWQVSATGAVFSFKTTLPSRPTACHPLTAADCCLDPRLRLTGGCFPPWSSLHNNCQQQLSLDRKKELDKNMFEICFG